MSEHELPADPADWPRDPTDLLGVSHNVDERDLKRAYTRLIRRFKPEHHPDEFAKIRAAYEEVLRRVQFMQQFRNQQEQVQEQEQDDIDDEVPSADDPLIENVATPPVEPPRAADESAAADSDFDLDGYSGWNTPMFADHPCELTQQMTAAWEVAREGDWASGYRQLQKLLETHPGYEDLCLRLYWLLRLQPDLDPRVEPAHWLIVSLKHNQLYGRAWELYRLELERQPSLGATDECRSLLAVSAPVERLGDLAQWRWRAIAQSNLFSLIQSDLEGFRERFLDESPAAWARMLFRVLDLACWSTASTASTASAAARSLVKYCDQALDELTELQFQLSAEFERLEILKELMTGPAVRDKWKPFPKPWALLIRDSWNEPVAVLRPRLLRILEDWIERPRDMLKLVDGLQKSHAIALQQLSVVITRVGAGWQHRDAASRLDQIAVVLAEFMLSQDQAQYPKFRLELLDFSIQWQVRIDEIILIFTRQNCLLPTPDTLTLLNNDLPLRTVLDGSAAFWNVAEDN